ncbi:putative pyrroloquinoline-quinone binding quinoprotein [Kribbella amoyensis]|uniref:Putative pyrroloquinoline-quinone binding quinoprotein n=1 Tax=Kribbella amoyensis TaxID=996641 RepID=A0A561B2X8_9ACTN|nr:PQQ-binding-like beta-propeller repeat protein [Kribbella amoyensis]TWD73215.1 putative pyrroloquinoline-quinone binding quinoprotein [Kribbella amoyensis]
MYKRFAFTSLAVALILTTAPSAATAGTPSPVTVDNLGPASAVTSTSVAEQVGDRIWTATSGVSPVQVGAFDPVTQTVDRKIALPTGAGSWAMTHVGTDLYVGLYTPGDLYKIDTTTGSLSKVAQFGSFIWSIAATPDGKIVAGTYPDGGVHEYDPSTGATKSYGAAFAGEQYVRSIAADADTIYAGVGTKAHLVAIDRATGDRRDVLPAKYADRTFVATLALEGGKLAAGLSPTGTMLVFDTADLANPVEVQTPGGDQYVTAITVDEPTGDVYLGTRPSGTLYRYRDGALQRLGSPYDGAYFNRIFVAGSTIRAELTSQVVTYDEAGGTFSGVDLGTAGLPPAPEQAMGIAATRDTVLVSGKAGIQVHDLRTGTNSRAFLPGEAKTLTPVGREVYLGVYTLARVWSMKPDGTDLRELGRIENEQTRPTDDAYDERSRTLLISTEPDYGKYDGTLTEQHVDTGQREVHRGVVPKQSVRSVGTQDGIAYLGGATRNSLGTTPLLPEATVVAFDLRRNRTLWEVAPISGAQTYSDVIPYRGRLYVTTDDGRLAELDPRTGKVLSTQTIGTGQSRLAVARAGLFGTDSKRVFQVVPKGSAAPEVRTVLDGLNTQIYGYPLITASHTGDALYTIKDRDLIRVGNLPSGADR